MTGMVGALVLVAIGAFLANLPFISERILGVFARGPKPLIVRFAEVIVGYMFLGAIAFTLESHLHGASYSQGWEFYVVTAALFVVFAFPGFVYRYLWRKH